MDRIQNLRKELDQIDESLLLLLERRFTVVKEIGIQKKEQQKGIIDIQREKEIMDQLLKKAQEHNIHTPFIEPVWKTLFAISYELEKKYE